MNKVMPLMKKYKIHAILSPIFMLLEVVADIMIPYLMSLIVDVGISNRDVDYIVKIGLLMVLTAFLGILFGVLCAHCGATAGYGFAAEIRKEKDSCFP